MACVKKCTYNNNTNLIIVALPFLKPNTVYIYVRTYVCMYEMLVSDFPYVHILEPIQRQFKLKPVQSSLIPQTYSGIPTKDMSHDPKPKQRSKVDKRPNTRQTNRKGGEANTLHRPPVAIFIAQARQRQGCRHGTVKCVTFSLPHAKHASGTTNSSIDSSSPSSSSSADDDDNSSDGISGVGE
jgi:hypothetical protein